MAYNLGYKVCGIRADDSSNKSEPRSRISENRKKNAHE